MFILIGKLFYLCLWLFLLFNLVSPYPKPANIVANVGLVAFVLMHGLQAGILQSTMTNQEKKEDRFKALRLFLFGVFEALSWKDKNKK